MLTDGGLQHIADQMAEQNDAPVSHLAIGIGVTPAAAGDTALENEQARVALDSKARTGESVSYVGTFGPNVGTGAITEAGILNSAVGGKLVTRNEFAVKNKDVADTLQITITNIFQRV